MDASAHLLLSKKRVGGEWFACEDWEAFDAIYQAKADAENATERHLFAQIESWKALADFEEREKASRRDQIVPPVASAQERARQQGLALYLQGATARIEAQVATLEQLAHRDAEQLARHDELRQEIARHARRGRWRR